MAKNLLDNAHADLLAWASDFRQGKVHRPLLAPHPEAGERWAARIGRAGLVPLAAYELEELGHELRHRGVRYGAARELLEHRIAHVILTQMEEAGEACDDRTHEAVRRSRPVRAAVDVIWPKDPDARSGRLKIPP